MTTRLQIINNDTVLEETQTVVQTHRFSKNDLLRQKNYHESMIAKSEEALSEINTRLTQIQNEESKIR